MSTSRGTSSPSKLAPRTLAIASAASAAAAVIVNQVWRPGVLIGAAVTPLIVALVTEGLNRPAERISSITASAPRRRRREGVQEDPVPRPQPDPAAPGGPAAEPGYSDVHVYGAPRSGPRRGLRWALGIAVAAFLIAAVSLSVAELVFGGSVGGSSSRTTYFGGGGTETPTPTPTETPAEGEETPTPTPTPTETPAEGEETPTPTPTPTETPEASPTPEAEGTPTPAPTPTPGTG